MVLAEKDKMFATLIDLRMEYENCCSIIESFEGTTDKGLDDENLPRIKTYRDSLSIKIRTLEKALGFVPEVKKSRILG